MGNDGCGCLVLLAGTLALMDACYTADKAKSKSEEIEVRLMPITMNVLGGPKPETFYDLSYGNRVYVRIDGRPVEEYFAMPIAEDPSQR